MKQRGIDHLIRLAAFVRPYWRRAVLSLVLLTAIVFMDLAIPRLIQRIIDQGITAGSQGVVIETALWMLGISALSTVFAVGNNVFSVQVGESVARDLRDALFVKIQTFSYGDLDRQKTGQLMVRLSSDTSALQRLTQISLRIGTRAPLLMIGSLILMVKTAPSLALMMVPLLLITMGGVVFFTARMEPLFRSVQQRLDRLNNVLQENIAGVRVVKAFVRAGHEGARFEQANEAFTDHSVRVMRFMASMSPALTTFVNIGMVVVIWAGGVQAVRGELSVGQIVAFTNYLLTTMTPLIMMTRLANVWANGIASARRVGEVLDTVPEVRDVPGAVPLADTARGRVTFEGVAFRYNGSAPGRQGDGKEVVLQGIDLVAEPGETVAILGATGAGKSTLVNLIPRFYDVTAGRVLIDGVDVRQVQHGSLLALSGVVPQETVLFSGTVRDNIRYGCPDASDAEVVAAAQAAQAHDFILALPWGYDTRVEERGVNLSGGQKQRLAIARALLTRPTLLILDDSTSSVDVETETRIQDALAVWGRDGADPAAPGTTTFVVAQRISTVLNADKIVVLDRGRIAALGTHRELMRSSPIYREIYDSQLGDGVDVSDGSGGALR